MQLQMICMVVLTIMVFSMIILGRGIIARMRGLVLLLTYALIMFIWAELK